MERTADGLAAGRSSVRARVRGAPPCPPYPPIALENLAPVRCSDLSSKGGNRVDRVDRVVASTMDARLGSRQRFTGQLRCWFW